MNHRPFALLTLLGLLGWGAAAFAATGSISASPVAPVATGATTTTTITWSSSGTSNAQVWVSLDGAPETLFASGASGSAMAPWIVPGHDYRFRLYQGTEHTVPLASVTVLGVPAQGGNVAATPEAVDIPKGSLGTSVVTWATHNQATAEIWVSVDGAAETLVARAPSGSVTIPWIQSGHDYQFRLYAGTARSQLLDTARVWGDPAYKVGVDYHATGADFLSTAFLSSYHLPGVRSSVQAQLQGMADRGATLIHTRLWMVISPGGPDFGERWRLHFPLSSQEAANLTAYAQDVAATRAADGHRLRLDLTLLWLGAADYQMGSPTTGLGYDNLSAATFTSRVDQTVTTVLNAVKNVFRPDGRRVVDSVFLEGEVMIGAKANQGWFLTTHYPSFVSQVRAAGLNPSLYFLVAASEAEVLDNGFVDSTYPVLSGHRSMFWVYRSLRFLRDNGLPLPQRVDFSCYPSRTASSYATLVRRIFDDADATLPSLGLASKYGVAETYYFSSSTERRALGSAFAAERNVNARLERLQFWTTPDAGGPGIHFGAPFAVEDYLP